MRECDRILTFYKTYSILSNRYRWIDKQLWWSETNGFFEKCDYTHEWKHIYHLKNIIIKLKLTNQHLELLFSQKWLPHCKYLFTYYAFFSVSGYGWQLGICHKNLGLGAILGDLMQKILFDRWRLFFFL